MLPEGVLTPQHEAVDALAPKVERAVLDALRALGDRLTLVEAAAMVSDPNLSLPHDLAERLHEVLDPTYSEAFGAALRAVVEHLGVEVVTKAEDRTGAAVYDIAAGVPVDSVVTSGLVLDLTADTPSSLAYAERRAGALIRALDKGQREAVRTLVSRAIAEGIPPRDLAPLVRQVIGLSPQQATALLNHRLRLVRDGASPSRLARETEQYRARALRQRAETIARTELMDAMNAGVQSGWEELAESDVFPRGYVVREWLASFDERTCPECSDLDGERAGVDEAFAGQYDRPPAHPRCRCTMGMTTVDEPVSSPWQQGRTP